MKKYVFILILSIMFATIGHAQNLIARQTGSTTNFHIELDDAITKASSGDIIYLPGGYFPLSVPIDKELHIIGTGHHPGYSSANGVTSIGGDVYLNAGASRSSFEGIYFQNIISLNEVTLTNLIFKRCNLYHITYNGNFSEIELKYSTFIENVSRVGFNINVSYCSFYNNIFNGHCAGIWINNTFKNNIFMNQSWHEWNVAYHYVLQGSFSRFENNIFLNANNGYPSYSILQAIGNSVFCNNLFHEEVVFDGISNIGFNNYVGISIESIFTKLTQRSFLYSDNYQLNIDHNDGWIGTEGTDIGIYGGPSPWKDNCFPFNPQIISKSVAGYTNPDGTLKVSIQVAAQER